MKMQASSGGIAVSQSRYRTTKDYMIAGWASMAGTTIEWYDFFLYGTAAALLFNKIFFPTLDPILGTLAAFGTYGVGFIGRPMGGLYLVTSVIALAASRCCLSRF
jgi:MHS family shikimate/dehydroshikimate transporter-like MFS transporter